MAEEFPRWIQSLSPILGMYFSDTNSYRISQEGDRTLKIIHNNETAYSLLNSPEKKEELKQLILEKTQEEIEVRIERYRKKDEIQKSQEIVDIIQENIKFTVTKED
jgi:predicted transcriptional regulator